MNLHLESALAKKEAVIGVVNLRNNRALFYTKKACTMSLSEKGLDDPLSLKKGFYPQFASPGFNQHFPGQA